jgi:hypothetical protein
MSLFNWFTKSKKPGLAAQSTNTETDLSFATVPYGVLSRDKGRFRPAVTGSTSENQAARHLRQEQLYMVVRDEMLKAGALTSAYKFKVLSLDSSGVSYLVMMELPALLDGRVAYLTALEHGISLQAKNHYEIVVTAVYWRLNECIPRQAYAPARPSAHIPLESGISERHKHAFDPLGQDEVAAFKHALAEGSRGASLANPGQIIHSGKRSPPTPADFSQYADSHDYQSALGVSQYGTLYARLHDFQRPDGQQRG